MSHICTIVCVCVCVLTGPVSGEKRSIGRSRSELSSQVPWQPLSMHALVEYKRQKPAMGTGIYSQGRPPTWAVSTEA